ncbi:Uncharacterized protein OBRU01_06553, partial [Operophtera brumata]
KVVAPLLESARNKKYAEMEVQIRRHRTVKIHDEENVNAVKGKGNHGLPAKNHGLGVRGVLGDINTNTQVQRVIDVDKVACATTEFDKKTTLSRGAPSTRPPLRREESTAGHAVRAVARSRAALKDKPAEIKESINIYIQTKKTESKKVTKLTSIKENKESRPRKPILKEPIESLGNLKLAEEPSIKVHAKLQNHAARLQEILDTTPELPDDIEDIDANDNNSPLLLSTYIKDIYKYLTELEGKYPIEADFLKIQSVITGKMRSTLIDWLVEVQRQFSLVLETFHLTVGIIDRYLQYEEIYSPDVSDFVYVTDKAYSKADVFQCERDIMSKLNFCLARPIPLSFLRRPVPAMAHYRPSELAAAAICLSLYLLSSKRLEAVWTPSMVFYSGYSLEHLEPIIRKLAKIVVNVSNSKYQAVFNKYSDPNLAKVATLPQLGSAAIAELATDTTDIL